MHPRGDGGFYCPACRTKLWQSENISHFREMSKQIHRRKRAEIREALNEYKLARGCVDCGFRGHPAALEFDHLPGSVKEFNLSQASSECMSWDRIWAEVDKCEVVCANCHAIRSAIRRPDTLPVEDWRLSHA